MFDDSEPINFGLDEGKKAIENFLLPLFRFGDHLMMMRLFSYHVARHVSDGLLICEFYRITSEIKNIFIHILANGSA